MVDGRAAYWMPVDQYIGGIEHAILHLLYSRFWVRVMRDLGLVELDEPFRNMLTQGMVLNHIFSRKDGQGRVQYFNPADVTIERNAKGEITGATANADGKPVHWDGMGTMSKSKNNGVDPNDIVARYGADTARLFMLFTSPPEQSLEWSDAGIEGAARFLRRVWKLVVNHAGEAVPPVLDLGALDDAQQALRRRTHQTIAKVTDDVGRRYTFNTAIAAVMELANEISRFEDSTPQGRAVVREALEAMVLLLAPMVPHACHALWNELGHEGTVADARWPQADPAAMQSDTVQLVVQVNGKLRGHIEVAHEVGKDEIERAALADENVQRFIGDAGIERVIVVPGRLVNVVTRK
jgi:leucyl-tRNA synthetase